MTRQCRVVRSLALAAALLSTAGAQRATAAAYAANVISLAGYNAGQAYSISGATVVAWAYPSPTGGFYDAVLWNSSANSFVSLNPGADWNTKGYGVSGDSQVGAGASTTILDDHAFL